MWWRINRGGGDPFLWTADSADTAWAEGYRHTSEQGAPPASQMPRDTWKMAVDVTGVADLKVPGAFSRYGIPDLHPTRRQWTLTQAVGEACYLCGCRGALAPSAAHEGGRVLVVFRPLPAKPGLTPVPPPSQCVELPALPSGLRT